MPIDCRYVITTIMDSTPLGPLVKIRFSQFGHQQRIIKSDREPTNIVVCVPWRIINKYNEMKVEIFFQLVLRYSYTEESSPML